MVLLYHNLGYGEQTRFALRSLKKHQDKFDIHLLNVGWGRTGWITSDNDERQWIDELIGKTQMFLQQNQPNPSFDVSLQVTIPGEFENIAPVNIGYTAGIESTKAAPEWLDRCNRMNRVIVPSIHTKTVLNQTTYKAKDQFENEHELKINTPIDVCGYAARMVPEKEISLDLTTNFNFLTVAQWGPRKNLESTISGFMGEFFNDADVGLVVKTNMAKNNFVDKVVVEQRLKNLVQNHPNSNNMKCKIYFLHGNLEEDEMSGLFKHPKIKALVTTTHGEGFGLPIFEAVLSGLPVIAPAWSGHVDFLFAPKREKDTNKMKMKPHFVKIDYDIQPIQKDAVVPGILQEDSQWCYPKNYSVRAGMREMFKNHAPHLSDARKLREYILTEFEENKQYDKFVKSITDCLPAFELDNRVSSLEESLGGNLLNDIVGL